MKSSKNRWHQFLLLFLHLLFTACPEPTTPPEVAECNPGYHPCGEDSTDCCLDTTSHDFVWEIDTLGGYGSYLKDVVIIDENNVWVVGNIETDSGYYGAAVWDGEFWYLRKLEGTGISVSSITPRGIRYFSENDIWFASGSIYHWDGNETTLEWLRNIGTSETVEKIWASSQSNIFFVGNEGTIVHYDGSAFTRMESGTDYPLRRIYGVDASAIWVTGDDEHWHSSHTCLLFNNGSEWAVIYEENYPESPPDHPPFL